MQQTADVDANQTLAGTPVSGSFSCFCAVADVAMDGATVTDAAMTAVHGLSFFCYSVVEDAATTVYLVTTAADVDAAATNPYVADTFLNIPDIY